MLEPSGGIVLPNLKASEMKLDLFQKKKKKKKEIRSIPFFLRVHRNRFLRVGEIDDQTENFLISRMCCGLYFP